MLKRLKMADQVEILFKEVDTSNDGIVSLKELGKMFKKLNIKLSVQDVRSIIYRFDKDHNKGINLEEFRELIADVFQANTAYDEAYKAFKVFDKDGSNTITSDEVREACKYLDYKLTDEEVNELIKKMDTDGDGIICFDEFAKAYACGL